MITAIIASAILTTPLPVAAGQKVTWDNSRYTTRNATIWGTVDDRLMLKDYKLSECSGFAHRRGVVAQIDMCGSYPRVTIWNLTKKNIRFKINYQKF